ncbi:hypothetical protein BM449_12800 [Synechococcus sp. SynAce01]|nr:hypothetical protein BM449_12800 [Synechococcus sp. SynAce01]
MATCQRQDALPKLVLLKINNACWSALGGAVLSCQTAGAPLRNPESILQNHNGSAASFRA